LAASQVAASAALLHNVVRVSGSNRLNPKWLKPLAAVASCIAVLFASSVMSGCSSQKTTVQLKNNFAWHVQDPILSRFTNICSSIQLNVSGSFKKGTANFKGLPISADDGTDFVLSLKIPIVDPEQINFGLASGYLNLTKPIKLAGIPLPQQLALEPGKASAQVDFIGGLGDFLMNSVTSHASSDTDSGGLGNIIKTVNVKTMTLSLADGKPLDLGRLHLVVGPDSTVTMKNLTLNERLDYQGKAEAQLNFKPGCEYIGKHAEFKFNGGKAQLNLHAAKVGDLYSFKSDPTGSIADLTDCSYLFGKYKQCEAKSRHGILHIEQFLCEDIAHQQYPKFDSKSSMLLEKSQLLIRNPKKTFKLTSNFSTPIPAMLQLSAENGELATQWWTEKTNQADNVTMDMSPQASTTELVLGKTLVGPVQLSKEGDLDFSFDKGVSVLKQLKWSNDKKSFEMSCRGDSTISIPPNMSMSVLKDEGGTATTLPLNLDVDKAIITGSKGSETELNDLSGKVILTVDNGTKLTGNLQMSLVSCDLLGCHTIKLQTDGLSLTSDKSGGLVGINVCKLNVSNSEMSGIINEEIPTEQEYDVNKPLQEKQKWRYRNAMLKHVTVKNIKIKQLQAKGPGLETFTVSGDVAIQGTIEKGGLLSVIKKQKRDWDVCPWSATGQVEGDGYVKYKADPKVPLSDSKVGYEMSIDLKPADNVDLDWSHVDTGLLSKAEHAIITKFISSYDPKAFLKTATIKVFKQRSTKLDRIIVNGLKTAPTKDGLCVSFSSRIHL
jgi:hypothetical protein